MSISIIFDIETEGLSREEILATVPPFDGTNIKMGNRKNPDSILKHIENAEEEYYERFIERAALDARTAKIIAIGIRSVSQEGHHDHLHVADEYESIFRFWDWWNGSKGSYFIGFNILKFDLPFLVRRSWCVGVPVPDDVWSGRYFHGRFVDLMYQWSLGNREDMISLDSLARFLNLPGKKNNGQRFSHLFLENREQALAYLTNDLDLTEKCARRMMLL